MIDRVHQINYILDKERNLYKRWRMRRIVKKVLANFQKTLDAEMNKYGTN